jgi:predicted anti-sigma-YlaC factor YlaD
MNANDHGRAIDLLTLRDIEGISDSDARWLEAHLAECGECAGFADALSGAEQAVRAVNVMASASLVASTQAKPAARAEQLREQQARTVLISVSFCLGVLTSPQTASVSWKCGGWVADKLGLPSGIVEPGVLLFWLLPAVAIAVLMVAIPPEKFEGSMMRRFLNERMGGMQ